MAMRTSTRTDWASGDVTRKRRRAPSTTPRGTFTFTAWRCSDSPVPSQSAHGSVQVSPRPPQRPQVARTGTSIGTTSPRDASNFDSDTSAHSTSASAASPRKRSRTRSTHRPTDGESIAITSAKHSCGRPGIEIQLTIGTGPMVVNACQRRHTFAKINKNHARTARVPPVRDHHANPGNRKRVAHSGQSNGHHADLARMDLPGVRLFRRRRRKGLARADREQDFLAEGLFELSELQLRLALVAEHF